VQHTCPGFAAASNIAAHSAGNSFTLRLHGSITALATPFDASGRVDLAAWSVLVARQLAGGTQALVVAGSTGEAATLSDDEYASLLRETALLGAGRVPVLAGTGLSGTEKTVRQTQFARDCGADAALVVTPPYVRATQDGLRRHYLEVAANGGLPVVLYNVPGRTGCDLLPETVAALASHENIVAIKEARADAERMAALLALKSEHFAVLSGDDPTACRAMLAGADGVISVASNALPATFRRLADLSIAGKREEALELEAQLAAINDFLGVEPNPIPIKALLAALGLCHDVLRLPLLALSAGPRERLAAIATAVAALEAGHARALAA
jgi:4-hydroxy-tetrahydrodipicolinate synthase